MKIVSWNANCKFREKYKEIVALDADIYVIQECENPATCKDTEYRAFVEHGYWTGNWQYKGLMVFTTRQDINLERLDWPGEDKRFFIPVRVDDKFNLVASWACDPYCEELNDWLDVVDNQINDRTIIIGDLNSNVNLDTPRRHKIGKAFANALPKLEVKGITDMWHFYHKEQQGEESVPTFYLYRHLDKPLHLDHCFASPELVSSFNIHARVKWLNLSDHLPVEIEVNDIYNSNPTDNAR